ncbi:hypothetical protein [Anaerosacchariphilus polymeriproducens]|nr:hypothetical protein [Anaerosacchariphilus polymeriproducens]
MKNEITELFDNEIEFAKKMQMPSFVMGLQRAKEMIEKYFEEREGKE